MPSSGRTPRSSKACTSLLTGRPFDGLNLPGLGILKLDVMGICLRVHLLLLHRASLLHAWSHLNISFRDVEHSIFNAAARVSIGDGNKTHFWLDKWIDDSTVEDLSPDLYAVIPHSLRLKRMVGEALAGNSGSQMTRNLSVYMLSSSS